MLRASARNCTHATLGDLRPGSICAVARRCGKPTCHCAKPNDLGHDPQVRLTRKVRGKTIAESFPSPAAWHKAQAEIEEYHRFQQLSSQLLNVSERICQLRPVDVLDRARGQRHPGSTLLPVQRAVRGLLGSAPGLLISTFKSCTPLPLTYRSPGECETIRRGSRLNRSRWDKQDQFDGTVTGIDV
jgi:hypothetical protein